MKGCKNSETFKTSAGVKQGAVEMTSEGQSTFCPGAAVYLEQGTVEGDFEASIEVADLAGPGQVGVILSLYGDGVNNEYVSFNTSPDGSFADVGLGDAIYTSFDTDKATGATLKITRKGDQISSTALVAGKEYGKTHTHPFGPFSFIIQLKVPESSMVLPGVFSARVLSFSFAGQGAQSDAFDCDSLVK